MRIGSECFDVRYVVGRKYSQQQYSSKREVGIGRKDSAETEDGGN